jgi:hypothetical protein
VSITYAASTIIGGTDGANTRNLISGNTEDGVRITGATATFNQIAGNYIGTTVTGNAPLKNSKNGVALSNARFTVVGGDQEAQGNVISGNGGMVF